jgi:hypothetical protein
VRYESPLIAQGTFAMKYLKWAAIICGGLAAANFLSSATTPGRPASYLDGVWFLLGAAVVLGVIYLAITGVRRLRSPSR